MRHTYASFALDAGVSIFELARLMGTSVRVIDSTYGHLVRGSLDRVRAASRHERSGSSGMQREPLGPALERICCPDAARTWRARAAILSLTALSSRDLARATGLEPATSGVTGRRSNQLNYARWGPSRIAELRRS
jgi:hypothetical protein